jgi:PPM family protein phosphatase
MIRFEGKTDPGRRNGTNEDALGWDTDHNVWFVADGVGGRAAGQMASGIVKECLLRRAADTSVRDAIMMAHAAIVERAAREPEYTGMASTVVCAQIHRDSCEIVWVGDSRAYLYRQDTLRQLTRDHSFMEQLLDEHELTTKEILEHPNRDKLTNFLGGRLPQPSVTTVPLQKGDRVLLCSDGLTKELESPVILEILRGNPAAQTAVPALISSALSMGGRDNVSVIVIDFEGIRWFERRNIFLVGLIVATMGLGGAAAWYFFRKH